MDVNEGHPTECGQGRGGGGTHTRGWEPRGWQTSHRAEDTKGRRAVTGVRVPAPCPLHGESRKTYPNPFASFSDPRSCFPWAPGVRCGGGRENGSGAGSVSVNRLPVQSPRQGQDQACTSPRSSKSSTRNCHLGIFQIIDNFKKNPQTLFSSVFPLKFHLNPSFR